MSWSPPLSWTSSESLHSSAASKSQVPNHKTALPPHAFKVKPQHGSTFSTHGFSVLHAVDINTLTSMERWTETQRIVEAIWGRNVRSQNQNSKWDSTVNIRLSLHLMWIFAREDAAGAHRSAPWLHWDVLITLPVWSCWRFLFLIFF